MWFRIAEVPLDKEVIVKDLKVHFGGYSRLWLTGAVFECVFDPEMRGGQHVH